MVAVGHDDRADVAQLVERRKRRRQLVPRPPYMEDAIPGAGSIGVNDGPNRELLAGSLETEVDRTLEVKLNVLAKEGWRVTHLAHAGAAGTYGRPEWHTVALMEKASE